MASFNISALTAVLNNGIPDDLRALQAQNHALRMRVQQLEARVMSPYSRPRPPGAPAQMMTWQEYGEDRQEYIEEQTARVDRAVQMLEAVRAQARVSMMTREYDSPPMRVVYNCIAETEHFLEDRDDESEQSEQSDDENGESEEEEIEPENENDEPQDAEMQCPFVIGERVRVKEYMLFSGAVGNVDQVDGAGYMLVLFDTPVMVHGMRRHHLNEHYHHFEKMEA